MKNTFENWYAIVRISIFTRSYFTKKWMSCLSKLHHVPPQLENKAIYLFNPLRTLARFQSLDMTIRCFPYRCRVCHFHISSHLFGTMMDHLCTWSLCQGIENRIGIELNRLVTWSYLDVNYNDIKKSTSSVY